MHGSQTSRRGRGRPPPRRLDRARSALPDAGAASAVAGHDAEVAVADEQWVARADRRVLAGWWTAERDPVKAVEVAMNSASVDIDHPSNELLERGHKDPPFAST